MSPRTIFEVTAFDRGPGGPYYAARALAEGFRRLDKGGNWRCLVVGAAATGRPASGLIPTLKSNIPPRVVSWLWLPYAFWHAPKLENQTYQHLRRILRFYRPDIIHAHDIYAYAAARRLRKAVADRRIRLVLSIHSPGSTTTEIVNVIRSTGEVPGTSMLESWLKRREVDALLSADRVVFPSRGAALTVLKDCQLDVAQVDFDVLYNGVDRVGDARRGGIRALIGIPETDFLVGCIGRFTREKGMDIAIRALSEFRKKSSDAQMVFLGQGPQEAELRRLVENLGLANHCHFLSYVEEIESFFGDIDVLLCCNRRSAFDLTILEAMSSGVPIIATDVGGNREALGREDLLVSPNNVTEIAEGLLRLRVEGLHREAIGDYLRTRYELHFSVERMAETAMRLYSQVLRTR